MVRSQQLLSLYQRVPTALRATGSECTWCLQSCCLWCKLGGTWAAPRGAAHASEPPASHWYDVVCAEKPPFLLLWSATALESRITAVKPCDGFRGATVLARSCWALIASSFLSCDKQDVLLCPVGGWFWLLLVNAEICLLLMWTSGEWLWEMVSIWGTVASWAAEILKKFQVLCSWDFLSQVMDYFSWPIRSCFWVCSHCGAISWGTACFQQENVACHFRVWMEACANRKAPLWPQDEPSAPQGCGGAWVCAGWAQPQSCSSTTLAWGCGASTPLLTPGSRVCSKIYVLVGQESRPESLSIWKVMA